MNEKELVKDFIFTKWAEAGLTPEQIKVIIHTPMIKQGVDSALMDVMFKYLPIGLFTIPALAGSLYYNMTTPDITFKNKALKKRKDMLEDELEGSNIMKGQVYTIDDEEDLI